MADEMSPFDSHAGCPKCGGTLISARYCASARPADKCWPHIHGEHIHRTCQRCGYQWLEAVLQDDKEVPPNGR